MKYFPNNLAIVGNAPSELGTGNGKPIDSFDYVLRFNRYNISDEFVNDYGKKITHWFTFRDGHIFDKPMNKGLWGTRTQPLLQILSSKECILFTDEQYIGLLTLMKGLDDSYNKNVDVPSTGLCLLYWLYSEQGYINPNNVFGFNFFDQDKRHHYCDDQKFVPGHNGPIEKKVFNFFTQ